MYEKFYLNETTEERLAKLKEVDNNDWLWFEGFGCISTRTDAILIRDLLISWLEEASQKQDSNTTQRITK